MSRSQPKPESIARAEAIALLRSELMKHTDSETSACKFAAEHGIYCRGFSRFSDEELKQRFNWITRRRTDMSRDELEAVANRWQLARQDVLACAVACDVQQIEHDLCNGWADFTNTELAKFYKELTGNNIVVI